MVMRNLAERSYPALKVYRSSWSGFFAVGFFSFFVNLGALVSPIYMQQIFDRVMQSRHVETLIFLTVIVIFFLAVIAMLDAIRGSILASIARWWDETVHPDLLMAIVQSARAKGVSRAHAVSDLASIRQFVGSPSVLPFFDGPWVPFFILAIMLIHPALGLVAISAGLILVVIAVLNDRVTRSRMAGSSAARSRAQSTVDVAAQHADSVFSMGMLPGIMTRFKEDNDAVAGAQFAVASFTAKTSAISKFVRFTAQIGVLGLGAYYATLGDMTPGGMIAASIIMGRALAPAEQALGAWRSFVGAMQSHKRLTDLFLNAPLVLPKTQQPAVSGHLQINSVSLILPQQDKPLLRGVNLELQPATLNAIVGPSGSGKSTLCRMLIGALEPTSGSVRLDGVAMRNWDLTQLGQNVGYLAQSVELLHGSVKDNIARMGQPDDEEVVAAAQLAGCHDLINTLPQGYDTVIGPGGLKLSGGQAQRVGFARAIYGLPKLIVLDEPNANLDSEGDASLHESLLRLRDLGATVVIITHRPAALAKMDLIITLAEGGIQDVKSGEDYVKSTLRPVNDMLKKMSKFKNKPLEAVSGGQS